MKKIIDTHVHIWDLDAVEYSWLKNDPSILNKTYSIKEFLPVKEAAKIDYGILVQAANNFEDTDYMLQTTAVTPGILGITGWLPLENPDAAAEAWENKYSQNPYFKAVRHLMHDEPANDWILQPKVVESLNYLANNSIPYEIVATKPEHMYATLMLIEKLPHLKIVLDHLSQPPMQDAQAFEEWQHIMKAAASHNNVYAKISGLGTASKKFDSWTESDITPAIENAISIFGTDRCFLGGDWPVSLLAGSYEDTWKKYHSVLNSLQLSSEASDNIYYNNAAAFYNL